MPVLALMLIMLLIKVGHMMAETDPVQIQTAADQEVDLAAQNDGFANCI